MGTIIWPWNKIPAQLDIHALDEWIETLIFTSQLIFGPFGGSILIYSEHYLIN